MRDTGFDPMAKSRKRDFKDDIHGGVGVDPFEKLGRELGQIPISARDNVSEDEDEDSAKRREEEEKKRKAQESPYKELYRDSQGNLYDPSKKFGIIQPDSLIYENVTSSYPLNLTTDYYQRYI